MNFFNSLFTVANNVFKFFWSKQIFIICKHDGVNAFRAILEIIYM